MPARSPVSRVAIAGHGEMRLIAFLIEPASIRAILAHLGEPTAPARPRDNLDQTLN
jgi:hypothetical protein